LIGERAHEGVGPGAVASTSAAVVRRVLLTVFVTGVLVLVFGAARAEAMFGSARAHAVPSVTFECTPAPADCSGWYRSNVSIDWTVLPSTATVVAGCQDKTLTTDTAGTSEFCSARDGSTVTLEVPIKIDKTRPVVLSGSPGRGADVNGWYNHPVGISFRGSDQTSGIDFCTSTTYSGPDTGAASVSGTCTDKAGNVSSSLGFGLKYDSTAPVLSGAAPERAPNAAGWFNRAVRFDVQASDATSGIADCPSVTYNGPNSATASFTGTCRDRAGNLANRTFGLKYDSTAPVATAGHLRRGPDSNGWYNQPVAVDFSGTDQLSGVDSCTTTTYSGPDGSAVSVPGTCTDRAGNLSSPITVGLKYDATAPVLTGANPDRPPNAHGWYNRPVRFELEASDATSGIAECGSVTYSGPDSATGSLSDSCRDQAGNTGDRSFVVKYDATPPLVTGGSTGRAPDHAGWFTSPVMLGFTGRDETSGVDTCTTTTYSGPDSGSASLPGTCTDKAGNLGSAVAHTLKYDGTAPRLTELKARAGDGRVAVRWHTTADTESVEVVRTPGLRSKRASVVFRGRQGAFADTAVVNRVRYVYEVRVQDAAGNSHSRHVAAVPGPRLLYPRRNAVVSLGRPPLLQWTKVRGASYYNVQLLRNGRKILTAWPSQQRYQVRRRWSYRGRSQRLIPGGYRWLVWPGKGPRSKNDYGKLIGRGVFRVTR
jgi:hypothetical protein